MSTLPSDIYEFSGPEPGQTSAILAGVHGDEKAGIIALKNLMPKFQIQRGKVFVIFGNPVAIERNTRQVEENLNRCFIAPQLGKSLEAKRAKEILPFLDQATASLDLHSTHSKTAVPFLIVDGLATAFARQLDFSIISTGWNILESGGTDGYMCSQNKIGICAECGSITDLVAGVKFAEKTIHDFLILRGHINGIASPQTSKRYIRVNKKHYKQTPTLRFAKDYKDFENLQVGKPFAWDGNITYIAQSGECIVFPRPNNSVGDEVFILGKEMKP